MVIEAIPVIKAIDKAIGRKLKSKTFSESVKIIFFSPKGTQFTNEIAEDYKDYKDIVLVCGRYEGIDARVKEVFPMIDMTIGPYVLTGGELPAMVIIDSISRRINGVLGDIASVEENRISSSSVYTRPETIVYKKKKYSVPQVLLTGHHEKIDQWKKQSREQK
jgi:tRNA (guanine37-N1)-methyltransferase